MKKIILIILTILSTQITYGALEYKPCGGTHPGNSNQIDDVFIREKLESIYQDENICDKIYIPNYDRKGEKYIIGVQFPDIDNKINIIYNDNIIFERTNNPYWMRAPVEFTQYGDHIIFTLYGNDPYDIVEGVTGIYIDGTYIGETSLSVEGNILDSGVHSNELYNKLLEIDYKLSKRQQQIINTYILERINSNDYQEVLQKIIDIRFDVVKNFDEEQFTIKDAQKYEILDYLYQELTILSYKK